MRAAPVGRQPVETRLRATTQRPGKAWTGHPGLTRRADRTDDLSGCRLVRPVWQILAALEDSSARPRIAKQLLQTPGSRCRAPVSANRASQRWDHESWARQENESGVLGQTRALCRMIRESGAGQVDRL